MGNGYASQPSGVEGLAARIKSLERRLDALSQTAPSKSTTIADENGDPQIHLGALESGGYGIEQIIGGNWVPLAQLAGGAAINTNGSSKAFNMTGSGGYTSWEGGGPDVTFETYTGKWILIMISATSYCLGATGFLGYATSGAQEHSEALSRSAKLTNQSSSNTVGVSSVYAELISGSPGEITVSPRYRGYNEVGGGSFSAVTWENRATLVIPY